MQPCTLEIPCHTMRRHGTGRLLVRQSAADALRGCGQVCKHESHKGLMSAKSVHQCVTSQSHGSQRGLPAALVTGVLSMPPRHGLRHQSAQNINAHSLPAAL